jgi:hypothetical protein
MEARSCNHCCSGKAKKVINITYSECMSVAMHVRHIGIWHVLRYNFFFHIFLKRHHFRKKVIELKQCILIFSQFCPKFLILRNIERYTIKNLYWSACEVPGILVRCYLNSNCLAKFSKNVHTKFNENQSSGTQILCEQAGGRTGREALRS